MMLARRFATNQDPDAGGIGWFETFVWVEDEGALLEHFSFLGIRTLKLTSFAGEWMLTFEQGDSSIAFFKEDDPIEALGPDAFDTIYVDIQAPTEAQLDQWQRKLESHARLVQVPVPK